MTTATPPRLQPRLVDVHVPKDPEGVVVVLHGGGSRGSAAVSPTQLSVLRMIPVARAVARESHGRLAVFRVLNSSRGWSAEQTPVADARWALDEIAERLGSRLPAVLLGHSLGGRAALLAISAPGVRGAVALAPYVYGSDVPRGLTDQRILVVHGDHDRVASYERSAALARALSRSVPVEFVTVEGGTHSMLRHRAEFDGAAARWAAALLLRGGA